MPRHRPPSIRLAEYIAARLAVMGLSVFDLESNLDVAAAAGRWFWKIDRRHRERALANLRLAFPGWSAPRIERTAERSFEHFVQFAVETLQMNRLVHPHSWAERVIVDDSLRDAIGHVVCGRSAIFITGHVGNFEMQGNVFATLGFKMSAVARPLDNAMLNRWLLSVRERRGLRIIDKWNATDTMIAALENGGSLGLIADQNAGDRGLFVPFFGRLASTYKSVGLLAMSQGVPVICGYAHREHDPACSSSRRAYRYRFGVTDFITPDDWRDRRDPLYYIAARSIRAIEKSIRLRPEQYFWMHRRWKSRPRHEREDKPVPASLVRKLRDLPWLADASDAEIDSICASVPQLA